MWHLGDPDVWEALGGSCHRLQSRWIVGVYAHEHRVAGVLDGRQIVREHLLNHAMFMP